METKVTTSELVRFNWLFITEPKDNDGRLRYETVIIIPKTAKKTLKAIESAINAAEQEGIKKYGSKWKMKNMPLHDGDIDKADKPDKDVYKDSYFFTARSKNKPGTVNARLQFIDPAEIKSGNWGNVSVNFYPYNEKAQGVGVGLNHIQKVKDGELLGAYSNPLEDFEQIELEDDDIM